MVNLASLLQRPSYDASTSLHCMILIVTLGLWQAVLAITSTLPQTRWHPELVATI